MKAIPTLVLALLAAGCAAPGESAVAEPLEARAARVAAHDPIEAFRLLRKGVENQDPGSASRFLTFAERKESTVSQRIYARHFVEKTLAAGGLRERAADLRYRLAQSWNFVEPRSTAKVRENLEALSRLGLTPELAASEVLREMAWISGARMDGAVRKSPSGAGELVRACDAGGADEGAIMGQKAPASLEAPAPGAAAGTMEVSVWAGGNDKLLEATGVLAFLVNERGEPVFWGRHLWIRNGSNRTVAYSVPGADVFLRELRPGAEEQIALEAAAVSGIDVSVRSAQLR